MDYESLEKEMIESAERFVAENLEMLQKHRVSLCALANIYRIAFYSGFVSAEQRIVRVLKEGRKTKPKKQKGTYAERRNQKRSKKQPGKIH